MSDEIKVDKVFDLKGLRASNLNARTFELLKKVITINVCFPEVRKRNCTIVLSLVDCQFIGCTFCVFLIAYFLSRC